jgi:hypothetical protein
MYSNDATTLSRATLRNKGNLLNDTHQYGTQHKDILHSGTHNNKEYDTQRKLKVSITTLSILCLS